MRKSPRLSFLMVGTPRSGTTLTQRICCELPDVVMPPETHFLHLFAPALLARRRFPLTAWEVAAELSAFAALPTSDGLRVDQARVLELVGPRCERLIDLFSAVVVASCPTRPHPRPRDVRYGEKTPEHLLWWRAATTADPELKIIGVVRDPRAVAASHRAVPWGIGDPAELAEEWAFDQRLLRAAQRRLGPRRCLVVRYEDLVGDPDACRTRLAGFLGVPDGSGDAPPPIVHSWEWWKSRALQPVAPERRDAWRAALRPEEADVICQVAGAEMAAFGYLPSWNGRRRPTGGPRQRLAARLRRMRALESVLAGRADASPGLAPCGTDAVLPGRT